MSLLIPNVVFSAAVVVVGKAGVVVHETKKSMIRLFRFQLISSSHYLTFS